MINEKLPPLDDETIAIIDRWRRTCHADHTGNLTAHFMLMCRSCAIRTVDEILKTQSGHQERPLESEQEKSGFFSRLFGRKSK